MINRLFLIRGVKMKSPVLGSAQTYEVYCAQNIPWKHHEYEFRTVDPNSPMSVTLAIFYSVL
jgi:hypothetical protein